MKNKNKARIDTYKSLYPVELVVANEFVTIGQLRKLYSEIGGTELQDDNIQEGGAITIRAIRKSDEAAILLVRMGPEDSYYKDKLDRKIELIATIAHESGHVALDTWDRISERETTGCQEPFCYYLQWITKCICTTIFKN